MSLQTIRKPGDEQLLVNFRRDRVTSDKNGMVEIDFIRIAIPGDKNTVIDTLVTPEYAERFAPEYAAFKRSQETGQIEGTPLEDWPDLNQYQIAELKVLNIFTIEQIASLSDGQVQRIGMGGLSLRDAARKKVGAQNGDELAAMKAENAEIKAQLAELMARIPKRGRPAKAEEHTAEAE